MELLLLSQFNLDSPFPTFFELYAKERLVSTMADAFRFMHASLSDRYTTAALAMPYNAEIFVAAWALIERAFVNSLDATFSENFFGIKRARILPTIGSGLARPAEGVAPPNPSLEEGASAAQAAPQASQPASAGAAKDESKVRFGPITNRDRTIAVLTSSILPYLRQRLRTYYSSLIDTAPDAVEARNAAERQRPWMKTVNRIFVAVYPWLHMVNEGAALLLMLGYLFKKTPHYQVHLFTTKVALRRMNRQDYMQQNAPSKRRVVLFAQALLMSVVLGFRFLEWWSGGGGASSAVATTQETKAPPSPPEDHPAAEAIEPGNCPVCRKGIVNAAVNTVNGVVGCYPCMTQSIDEHGRCPVTSQPCTAQQLRRLYEV